MMDEHQFMLEARPLLAILAGRLMILSEDYADQGRPLMAKLLEQDVKEIEKIMPHLAKPK
jgi:hypothetical protein